MKSVQGIVEDFKSFGPNEGKFGEFYNNSYVIGGKKYGVGFARNNTTAFYDKLSKKEIPVQLGSNVTVFFETNTTEKGTFNNVTTMALNEENSSVESVSGEGLAPVTKSKSVSTISTTHTPAQSNGARLGMIANNAITLAIARGDSSLEGLLKSAQDVKTLVEELENPKVTKAKKTTKAKADESTIQS